MKKRTVMTLGIVALVAVLAAAGASVAWLTSAASTTNTMIPATVEIQVVEENFTPPATVTVGTEVNKDVSVKNLETGTDHTGTAGRPGAYAYIRVALVPVWRNSDNTGTALPIGNVQLNTTAGDSNDWFYSDGYYYYKNPVAPGATTSKLLDSYKVTSLTDEYAGKKLEITVLASAVQSISDAKNNWPAAAVAKLSPMS